MASRHGLKGYSCSACTRSLASFSTTHEGTRRSAPRETDALVSARIPGPTRGKVQWRPIARLGYEQQRLRLLADNAVPATVQQPRTGSGPAVWTLRLQLDLHLHACPLVADRVGDSSTLSSLDQNLDARLRLE